MPKLTRISYNSKNWQRPTGDAKRHEAPGTYNHEHGFGHEDWLFRSEWLIEGWRYAFLQGVNKSHRRLVEAGEPVDLTLFTIEPDKRRRYVATIDEVECLDNGQAEAALEFFKQQGWFQTMLDEVAANGGNSSALGDSQWAKHILNVRFRLENVTPFNVREFAAANDPVIGLSRYMLYDVDRAERKVLADRMTRKGSEIAPLAVPVRRKAVSSVEYTPEHAKMQAKLLAELKEQFPAARIRCEEDFVDICLYTESERVLFEIKTDLAPRTVLRQALGQLLEYAFYPGTREYTLTTRLVVVGRRPLSPKDQLYLSKLRDDFSLPLEYRVVTL